MDTFVFTMNYSSAAWARMLKVADDRREAVRVLIEHLGGRLESVYWGVESAVAIVIAQLPDGVSATAAITAVSETGAFKDVHVYEVLTQDQLRDVVTLAKGAESVYRPPGKAAVERDLAIS